MIMLSICMLMLTVPVIIYLYDYAECLYDYAECRNLFPVILNVMLSVVMLDVVMLGVVAPYLRLKISISFHLCTQMSHLSLKMITLFQYNRS